MESLNIITPVTPSDSREVRSIETLAGSPNADDIDVLTLSLKIFAQIEETSGQVALLLRRLARKGLLPINPTPEELGTLAAELNAWFNPGSGPNPNSQFLGKDPVKFLMACQYMAAMQAGLTAPIPNDPNNYSARDYIGDGR